MSEDKEKAEKRERLRQLELPAVFNEGKTKPSEKIADDYVKV
ncbi:hypothetical protein [Bacillus atrophaeus]|nr:hypothetical protein [Bacillus atrophaeus]